MVQKWFKHLILIIFTSSCSSLLAQVAIDTTSLSSVRVVAVPIQTTIQNAAYSASVIHLNESNTGSGVILTSILNSVPGVYMQQGGLNTSRITLRGMGARTQYGTTRVKAYFQDIPLTTAEGESSIEDIDLASIGKIEIIKGPNATSFGAGLGGVIHLLAKEPRENAFDVKSITTMGSFGLNKQCVLAQYDHQKSNLFASYSRVETDGFRQNSSYNRKSVNLHGTTFINNKSSVSYIGIFTKLLAFIPSSISENDYINHPDKAAATWLASKGYESYNKFITGLSHHYQLDQKWEISSSLFANYKKAYEARPFDILDDKNTMAGLRTMLHFKGNLCNLPLQASFGTEMAVENYGFALLKNLYQTSGGQGSIAGAAFSKMKQNRQYATYFLQMELQASKAVLIEAGLAHNATRYSLQDIFQEASVQPKQSYTFGGVWSPRVGISYKLSPIKNIYASISNGFSTPTVAETLTPTGQINDDLKPELGWNYEIGFKGNWFKKKLYTELSLYSCAITNLLVARRTNNDQYIGINAGKSLHQGIEYQFNYTLIYDKQWQLKAVLSGTINHFRFKDFVTDGNDFSGNQLTGVPNRQYQLGFEASTTSGFGLSSTFNHVGAIPLNDQNAKYTQPYSLLDVTASYSFTILKRLKTVFMTAINNAGSTHYAASILPNAVGFGTAPPRYYYPGMTKNYYTVLQFTYSF